MPTQIEVDFLTKIKAISWLACLLLLPNSAIHAELISIQMSKIHPTQAAVGYDEIQYKIQIYQNKQKQLNKFCKTLGAGKVLTFEADASISDTTRFRCSQAIGHNLAQLKTAVMAPNQQVYLTDGHHTISTFKAIVPNQDLRIYLNLTHDLRHLKTMDAFWQYMENHRLFWPYDEQGIKISPDKLPTTLDLQHFADSPYRSALYFLEGIAFVKPNNAPPFYEFYLANWLQRQNIQPINASNTTKNQYLEWIQTIAYALTQADKNQHSLPISSSPTLAELGVLNKVALKEWNKLIEPSGKIAKLFQK